MSEPAYRRMDVDERRAQLLERGAELFTSHPYDELSMNKIAAEVGISKALLYHYFPSKQAFFEETLGTWAERLRMRTEPDPEPLPRRAADAPASTRSSRWSRRTRSPTAT